MTGAPGRIRTSDPQIRSLLSGCRRLRNRCRPTSMIVAELRMVVRTGGLEPPPPYGEQIFLPPRLSPPPFNGVRGLDYPFAIAVGRRRRPSSLHTFPSGAWLGIGLDGPLAFPEFERFYSAGFPAGTPMKSAASTLSPRPRWNLPL